MAERSSAYITIGGNLPERALESFIAVIENSRLTLDWEFPADGEDLMETLTSPGPLVLMDNEAAWGEFPALEEYCRKHNFSFVRVSESGPGYAAEIVWHTPDGEGETEADDDGYPMVPLNELRRILEYRTKDAQITQLQALVSQRTPPRIPPLTIVEG